VTTVRIAQAEPQPGRLANGGFATHGYLVVLADDAGHRAVPIWLPGAGDLADLLERPPGPAIPAGAAPVPQELSTRLLGAARARVTGVDIDVTDASAAELTPAVAAARITVTGPAGTRQVSADLARSLALAAATGAPVRLAGEVLSRLAVPVSGDDLLSPFLDRVPPAARVRPDGSVPGWPLARLTARRPRFEPRNLDFADGLDRWELDLRPGPGWPGPAGGDPGRPDYAATADGRAAVLSAVAARPAGPAALVQAIYADDYRGTTVTFHGEIRTDRLARQAGQAGLQLEILRNWWWLGKTRQDHRLTIASRQDWTGYEITAPVPADADLIRFGIALTGPGRIELRHPGLRTP
jgi:hypothetical protein